jgi:hypothetical protein
MMALPPSPAVVWRPLVRVRPAMPREVKFLFDKRGPAPSFSFMASSEKKPFSFLILFIDLVITAIAFCIFYRLVRSHVPSNDPAMILLWGCLAASCMTGVFWLALQMLKTVFVFQRDIRK